MLVKTKNMKPQLKKEAGFTLVEVIAVLVILGILAAVAIPKFFDMQQTARNRAADGAVGELNGQVALAFAQNALNGNTNGAGAYEGFTGWLGPDFDIEIPAGTPITAASGDIQPSTGTLAMAIMSSGSWPLTWTGGDTASPGYYARGALVP